MWDSHEDIILGITGGSETFMVGLLLNTKVLITTSGKNLTGHRALGKNFLAEVLTATAGKIGNHLIFNQMYHLSNKSLFLRLHVANAYTEYSYLLGSLHVLADSVQCTITL